MPRADRASRNAARNAPYAFRSEQTNLIRTSPYTPIDSENGEIRLLELASGKFDDTIVMRLIPCNVMADDPDPYEALSYCWGTEMTPRMALLDGVLISITANLDCALRHLRLTIVRRTMWVDAISMNQEDTQERNHQVQIMGRIYSAAQRVIVWLGPTDHDNLYLRVVLGAMQFHFSEQSSTTVRLFDYMCGVVDIMNQQAGKDNDSRECVLDALHSIIDRPWFSRIWVVQELALAKVALVAIGNCSFLWQMFESFIQWLPHHRLDPRKRPLLAKQATQITKVPCDKHFSRQFLRTLHLLASDPRDKIFGILGISNFRGTCIVPDYTKSTEEVLLNATITLIRENTLALYYFMPLQPSRARQGLETVSGRPSWVPDLLLARAPYVGERNSFPSDKSSTYCLPDEVLDAGFGGFSVSTLDRMCSVLPFIPASFSFDLRKLCAPGILIGTIVETSGELLSHLGDVYSTSDQAQIIRHVYASVIEPHGIAIESLLRLLNYRRKEGSEGTAFLTSIKNFNTYLHQANIPKTELAELMDLVKNMVSLARDRIVFVTNNNKIGLAYHPESMHGIRSGDVVAGLFGINFPFILRPTDGGLYQMINVARVHGLGWGHDFLGNQSRFGVSANFHMPHVEDTQRKHRRSGRQSVSGITWKDYEHHGMREFVIV